MVLVSKIVHALAASCLAIGSVAAVAVGAKPNELLGLYKRQSSQNIVTWDEKSLFIHGERLMIFSGEFHPWRLPVPSLWLDVFQKIKALGYNGVSFYVDWALVEGKPGEFRADGVFAYEPFFEAAQKAGIYLLARPGPYINAEVSGGGFPGWLQRVQGYLRTNNTNYLDATDNYVKHIGEIVAKAQITNGGPVILLQPENEYSGGINVPFPQYDYWNYVTNQYKSAGVVVPYVNNEAWIAPFITTTTPAKVDIYGHDGYPLGFDCANPTQWPDNNLPTNWRSEHLRVSPSTPYSIIEFQGGGFDPWGGNGFDKCAALLNMEFERVFYKNNYAAGLTIFNIYMTYGGTNWGNLGHAGGYSSYDYGSVIEEDRQITREKYSEVKLQANFLAVSPAYLVADRGFASNTSSTNNQAITVTQAWTNTTRFYFTRHSTYNTLESTPYKLYVQTASYGTLTVPQLSGSLSLNGRDSKIHVSEYQAGNVNIVYSTAEIFTWKQYSSKTIIVVYGGPNELHELAVAQSSNEAIIIEGSGVKTAQKKGYTILNWTTSPTRRIVKLQSNVYIYLLDRNSAYNYWVPAEPSNYKQSSLIVKAGYLLRTAQVQGTSISLVGDLNATSPIEIIGGAPSKLSTLTFNGKRLAFKQDPKTSVVTATAEFKKPSFTIPSLKSLPWKYTNNLPELNPTYDDNSWTKANLAKTHNDYENQTTPTSLFSGDYGYHAGTLLYRGAFTASGSESTLFLATKGGTGYGSSAWLGDVFLGSIRGADYQGSANATYTLPNLTKGKRYIITVVVDNMGYDGNWVVGADHLKNIRGLLTYDLAGHPQSDVSWKITGNLGGEDYVDKVRGPLNEGGTYAERNGFHLPAAPTDAWPSVPGGPLTGISKAGIAYYATSFDLNLPEGYDIPLSFRFANSSSSATTSTAYRALIFVNGYQFGRYVHNIGPQDRFPVPEGIWNYQGKNYVGVSLWALDAEGAKLDGFELVADAVVQTGYYKVELSPQPKYKKRAGAY